MTKKKTSVTLEEDTLKWIRKKIEEKRFRSVSHTVEFAIEKLKREEG